MISQENWSSVFREEDVLRLQFIHVYCQEVMADNPEDFDCCKKVLLL